MAYTGRATYDDSDSMHEDVSDLVTLLTPHETPFLNYIGDPLYPALQTKHEWLDEALNATTDALNEALDNSETDVDVDTGTVFRVGDIIQVDDELMLVSSISTNTLTVTRGYGSSTAATHADNTVVYVISNAALEGDTAPTSRETSRTRRANYTQIFTAKVDVSGTAIASNWIGVANEFEHQKELRMKEVLWELERAVLRGSTPGSSDVGSDTVRRSIQGIMFWFSTNTNNASSATLTKDLLDGYIRDAWSNGARGANLLMCNAFQKSKIDGFTTSATRYGPRDNLVRTYVDKYETSFGVFDVMLNHNVPTDEVWMLNTDLIKVLPLKGRSFFHKKLGDTGDNTMGQLIGEYTLELRNEAAHMRAYGLATS